VTAFVSPATGESFWYVSYGISKPFFEELLRLFAEEAGAGHERRIVHVLRLKRSPFARRLTGDFPWDGTQCSEITYASGQLGGLRSRASRRSRQRRWKRRAEGDIRAGVGPPSRQEVQELKKRSS
jgi:hypothetical protein